MRRPRGAKFTDEQEAELSRTEAIMTRARIMERGVANVLNNADYYSATDIEVCAAVLAESVALRIDCETKREAIRKAEREANPRPEREKTRHRVIVVENPTEGVQ